jgi:regulator of CtrA degradation
MSSQTSDTPHQDEEPFVSFGKHLITSEGFRTLFREGMTLVEETAAYLDGEGREESRKLARTASLAYATESMRLTTRLMQIASWLLIQRAANEGEMNFDQAQQEKQKIRLTSSRSTLPADSFATLPEKLRDLIDRAERLQGRVILLDRQLTQPDAGEPAPAAGSNPIENQLNLIRTAFGTD